MCDWSEEAEFGAQERDGGERDSKLVIKGDRNDIHIVSSFNSGILAVMLQFASKKRVDLSPAIVQIVVDVHSCLKGRDCACFCC
jgi:hypothetical protein